jgi:hypothetical protein
MCTGMQQLNQVGTHLGHFVVYVATGDGTDVQDVGNSIVERDVQKHIEVDPYRLSLLT